MTICRTKTGIRIAHSIEAIQDSFIVTTWKVSTMWSRCFSAFPFSTIVMNTNPPLYVILITAIKVFKVKFVFSGK